MTQATIGIVLYPGVQMSAVLGLTDLFALSERSAENGSGALPRLRVRHLHFSAAAEPDVVFDSDTASSDEGSTRCEVLLLPPSLEPPIVAEAAAPIARWLCQHHAEGSVLASVCGGAFVLAETGLLAGRTVTTHWTYAQALQDRCPDAQVDADRLIIDQGDIISAGGLMSWIDLGLILVNRFLGPVIMARTARMMLVDLPGREQRFYSSFVPRLSHGDAAILKAQHYLQAQEGKETRLAVLAEQAGLEKRTFLRRFQKATGLTATDYAQRLRVAKAQELLQFGKQPVERVAWQVGYSDPGAFRKVFHRIVGLTPGEYRQRFYA
ncbi:helix-turn-helix domain-containing protein [Paracoccus liaowanqingii]|uniref:Helix-turn-helix domain-containing protein n=1 Tax=Paracoccus liaowanqingii TaxID=2560053 RepID=A0A4Z1CBI6_9RHOB|nr:helix-turn-helix domain-containing protein [Paracoccus liaowanqingii]TGN58382.1 helix-turn-helix domain-containing protein [Paracoccus liaowanqingii]